MRGLEEEVSIVQESYFVCTAPAGQGYCEDFMKINILLLKGL